MKDFGRGFTSKAWWWANFEPSSICTMVRFPETVKTIASNPSHLLDPSFYSKILKLCFNKKTSKYGRLVHSRIVTNGLGSNLQLGTALIVFYVKILEVVTAHKVFDQMPERNVVPWTALISGYCQIGYNRRALLMFVEMRRDGVRANQFTYGSTLRACTSMGCLDAGMQVHGCIAKGRFVDNIFVQSALIDFHSKCGKIEDARWLFEKMSKRDMVSWNAMIGGYAVQGSFEDSVRLFQLMIREGLIPDCFTLGSALRACAGGGSLKEVIQVHKFVIQLGFACHVDLNGSLVDAYAKCGSIRWAYQIYKNMGRKDLISCTALVTAYAREGKWSDDVGDLFKELIHMQIGIDGVMLCSMLHVCASAASLSLGRQIHALAFKCQSHFDVAFGNALVDMYAKSGEIEDANRSFDEMAVKNVISWTSLIAGYARHGLGHVALALYKKMECEGLKPNDITFLCVLFACSHNGLTEEGWECFNNMIRKYNLAPRLEHLSCMVDLSARAGQLEEAYNLIHEMKVKPDASCWGAILSASRVYGSAPLGEAASSKLISMDPENAANYVTLASIYAEAGAWEDVRRLHEMMEERVLKKEPGSSLLQSTKKKEAVLQPS